MRQSRSYVLRIYRTATAPEPDLAGVVQALDSGLSLGFRDSKELLSILLSASTGNDGMAQDACPATRPLEHTVIALRTTSYGENKS